VVVGDDGSASAAISVPATPVNRLGISLASMSR
jgi:hypothetical protein